MTREEAITYFEDAKEYCESMSISTKTTHISAYEIAIEALNKQIGTKPYKMRLDEWETRILCPQCNYLFYSLIDGKKITGNQSLYCPCCGQRIDWEEK